MEIDDKGQEFIELEDGPAPLTKAQLLEVEERISAAINGLDLKEILEDIVRNTLLEMRGWVRRSDKEKPFKEI